MSFRVTAAHSSGVKKSKKPPSLTRSSSSPFAAYPRRKPAAKHSIKEDPDDEFGDRLDDVGLVHALATDLILRDVSQAIIYIKRRMWTPMPDQRAGMSSTRIAEVLNYRAALPPIVTVSHLQALLNSATTVEREIAELINGGAIRKMVVGGRGSVGEVLILAKDFDEMIEKSSLEAGIQEKFLKILHDNPAALTIPRVLLMEADAKAIMHAGFITTALPTMTTTDRFSAPGEGSHGTITSINSISRAASGSMAAVGGDGAVHAAGGSGGGVRAPTTGNFSIAIPSTGSFIKLIANARSHFMSLLSKSKFREAPETLLRERWDGGISSNDEASASRRRRGEFDGVMPGRTRKWKLFYGISYEWILEECVGAGLVEVFETGSIGRGVRAL